MNLVFYCDKA